MEVRCCHCQKTIKKAKTNFVDISHGICKACMKIHFPEFVKGMRRTKLWLSVKSFF